MVSKSFWADNENQLPEKDVVCGTYKVWLEEDGDLQAFMEIDGRLSSVINREDDYFDFIKLIVYDRLKEVEFELKYVMYSDFEMLERMFRRNIHKYSQNTRRNDDLQYRDIDCLIDTEQEAKCMSSTTPWQYKRIRVLDRRSSKITTGYTGGPPDNMPRALYSLEEMAALAFVKTFRFDVHDREDLLKILTYKIWKRLRIAFEYEKSVAQIYASSLIVRYLLYLPQPNGLNFKFESHSLTELRDKWLNDGESVILICSCHADRDQMRKCFQDTACAVCRALYNTAVTDQLTYHEILNGHYGACKRIKLE